jgi:transcriptional regulator with XRE-family HTH domain
VVAQLTPNDIIQARARRLLLLRGLAGLSRDQIFSRYGIAKATLQNWESGRAGGLTKKGADRVLKAYQREHILCTHDWLLQGVGASPVLMDESRDPAARRAHAVFSGLAEDIAYLRSLYDHVVDLPIADQSMMPDYPQSAHVVGISHYKEQILSSVGKDCIVHAVGHPPIFRRLLSSGDAQRFHLVPLNLSGDYPIITDVEVLSVAPVLWVRADAFTYHSG